MRLSSFPALHAINSKSRNVKNILSGFLLSFKKRRPIFPDLFFFLSSKPKPKKKNRFLVVKVGCC